MTETGESGTHSTYQFPCFRGAWGVLSVFLKSHRLFVYLIHRQVSQCDHRVRSFVPCYRRRSLTFRLGGVSDVWTPRPHIQTYPSKIGYFAYLHQGLLFSVFVNYLNLFNGASFLVIKISFFLTFSLYPPLKYSQLWICFARLLFARLLFIGDWSEKPFVLQCLCLNSWEITTLKYP